MDKHSDKQVGKFLVWSLSFILFWHLLQKRRSLNPAQQNDNSNPFEQSVRMRLDKIEHEVKTGSAIALVTFGIAVLALGITGITLGANILGSIVLILLGLLMSAYGGLKIPGRQKRKSQP